MNELKDNYQISSDCKVLGFGSFGKVFLVHNKHNQNQQVAIKVMNKEQLGDNIDLVMKEVEILSNLDHPSIVKYHEIYNDPKFLYLVMEYIDGESLLELYPK